MTKTHGSNGSGSPAPVAGVGDPGSANGSGSSNEISAADDSATPAPSEYQFPNSRRVYVNGELHPDIRVPFREISQAPTKAMSGELEPNEPIRVYDCSGPWGDEAVAPDVTQGLPALRHDWVLNRGDVEEYDGRVARPIDDGYLSETHAQHASSKRPTSNVQHPTSNGDAVAAVAGRGNDAGRARTSSF